MLEYLNGKIAELSPTKVVLDVHGLGFDLNISLNSYTALEGKEKAKLYVVENIREDAWVLFGFATAEERTLFNLLNGISGIGGMTARTILSSLSVAELCTAIQTENERLLTGVKGLGKRTAQRIIIELKDKIPQVDMVNVGLPNAAAPAKKIRANAAKENEAIQALTMLGFSPAPTKKVVEALSDAHPELSTEELIKQALKSI